jgi:hypothetical protein
MKAFRMFLLAAAAAALTAPASANLFLDEGFETGTPFTNRDYPVRNPNTTAPSVTPQGTNVRCEREADAAAPQFAVTNTGTVSAAAAYTGSNGLQLASGQSVAVNNSGGLYTNSDLNNHVVMQFALAFPASVFSLPANTQVGSYAQNWDTDNLATPASEVTYQLNFKRNGTGGVDIIVNNNSTIAKTVTAANTWSVITVVAAKAQEPAAPHYGGYTWIGWDPFNKKFVGPQPASGDPNTGAVMLDQCTTLTCGIHLYVNSNTDTNFISNTALGATPTWCGTDATKGDTALLTWSLAAENGGTLLVDDMFFSMSELQGITSAPGPSSPNFISQEYAARLVDFTGPAGPGPTAAKDWSLFE